MAKYSFTNKAIEDISNIWEYTFDNWSEKQADKYYSLLISLDFDTCFSKKLSVGELSCIFLCFSQICREPICIQAIDL
jgi:hypothetical protein